jgi:hypothetical protein
MLFGESLFDSAGRYARGLLGKRQIHLDINTVLHGSGVIGLLLFIGFYIQLYRLFLKYKRKINFIENRLLISTFYGLYFSSIFLLFSGGMTTITFNLISALYMGGILGYFRNLISSQNIYNDKMIYSNLSTNAAIEENSKKAFLFPTESLIKQ